MADGAVDRVRSFNRVVSERVGALNDRYLARERPLGEARLLWEIGREGCDVRQLRARLALDSGYASRLLRSLEAAGLVTVAPSADDRRVRTARLTRRGLVERDLLDRRSDQLARSFLEPLSSSQRDRLVAAMAEVERLLTAGLVEFRDVDPADEDARYCLGEYFAELGRRFDGGFDAAMSTEAHHHQLRPPAGLFVVAMLRTEPVGCGGLKLHGREPAELKRMWVSESVRGLGIGRRLLTELENRAAAAGVRVVRLETNRALAEAIGLYRSAGYREVAAFNDEVYAHHWFEKLLASGRDRVD
ncbi:MAG TPA: helix-turn-helix domain-containing GNAT family N-acetyltransferase [Gaiellaceae bacterium]|nr:helix-turn-helix domain-containing GNAT family N-acetyltransferase [Gaiellaceae bacterium]